MFPDPPDKLDSYEEDEKIEVVKDVTAKELVIGGARFQIGKRPRMYSECALILWYDNDGDLQKPVIVEFSFRYRSKDGEYKRNTAYRGYRVTLQQELTLVVGYEFQDKDSIRL